MRARALVVCALALCSCGYRVDLTHQAPATFSSEPPGYEAGVVTRVVDGDTAIVKVTGRIEGPGAGGAQPGRSYRVRFLGINTPESVKPDSPVECFGREASAATHALLTGVQVRMVKDVEETDAYGRLLRYLYIGDEMVNARLVANGYAQVFTYPPNVRHADLFVQLQQQARDNNRGLWSPNTCNGRP
ncbi:MAG: micrococcal nuclease [Actinomycetota bacterium]|jgi:micrococcal nuclease|nr:micrococcal nuclease [Actinomycetota bacterium]MEA2486979.1 micrococcal nuclease [Actinomycetota bacterium]